ncbi:MAG: helix-turn-helix transcriptional regulator [Gammaproteobacteria bacterium]|nr:helix-turn-helix transcriptional regulator [Gammaproteobacteria bacterium]
MNHINKLTLWSEVVAQVINHNFNAQAIGLLLKGLEQLIDASSGMITVFPAGQSPQTVHHRLLANEKVESHIEAYDNGAYLLDPFYCQAVESKIAGAFTIKDVAPDSFEQSDYFRYFYAQLGFRDEICILFQAPDGVIISISFVRHSNESPFVAHDIEQLNIVYPLLKSIINKWRQQLSEPKLPNLERQLDNALVKFGSSILTPGEGRVLKLILHGHSIKSIADKLENSAETIKYHRKNIYIKLDVSTQSELFYLFIASLKAIPDGLAEMVDPLTFLR